MTLMHYRPAKSLESFSNLVDHFFNEEDNSCSSPASNWQPRVDVSEFEDRYEFVMEAPGLNKEDFQISLENNVLTVSGERKQEEAREEKNFHHVERYYGSFERSFRLPKEVQTDSVSAKYESGLLKIHVPKAEEAKPREIKIN